MFKVQSLHFLVVFVVSATIVYGQPVGFAYSTSPELPYEEVKLERLNGDGFFLEGKYAKISNIELGWVDIITQQIPQHEFKHLPHSIDPTFCKQFVRSDHDCSFFDDVNAYYHIDKFAHEFWVEKLGHQIDYQVHVITHLDGLSFSNYKDLSIHLAHGDHLSRDEAKDRDTIYHEYTHIVLGQLGLELDRNSSEEAQAIHEGYADYFSATFTGDPNYGEWVMACPARLHCEGPENDTEIRTLETDARQWNWHDGSPPQGLFWGLCIRYGELDFKCKRTRYSYSNIYNWGMIWGSALWDLRTELGASLADKLIFEGIKQVKGNEVKFKDAYYGLLLADLDQYNGVYRDRIIAIMANRGIGLSVIGKEATDVVNVQETISIYPNPTTQQAYLELTFVHATSLSIELYDILGKKIDTLYNGIATKGRFKLPITFNNLPPSLYFIQIKTDTEHFTKSILVIH